jgi:hypothetical protein
MCRHLKEGDYVLFSPYSGDLVFLQDEGRVIVMREIAVIAVIQPPGTDVPGLYFRDALGGAFFGATYEVATQFIASAFRNSEWRRKYDLKAKMIGGGGLTLKEEIEKDWVEEAILAERARCLEAIHEELKYHIGGREYELAEDICNAIEKQINGLTTESTQVT